MELQELLQAVSERTTLALQVGELYKSNNKDSAGSAKVAKKRGRKPKIAPDGTVRPERPRIDLDEKISAAASALQIAKKAVAQARTLNKLEKRKKSRLTRKAARLNMEDLERLMVLKRTGDAAIVDRSAAAGVQRHAEPAAKMAKGKTKVQDSAKDAPTPQGERPVPFEAAAADLPHPPMALQEVLSSCAADGADNQLQRIDEAGDEEMAMCTDVEEQPKSQQV